MAIFKQLRYFGDNDPRNSKGIVKDPDNETLIKDALLTKKILIDSEKLTLFITGTTSIKIKHLGIQSTPGTEFYINDLNTSIIIGQTGIFELDLTSYGSLVITSLSFTPGSIRDNNNGSNSFLIVDLKYEETTTN